MTGGSRNAQLRAWEELQRELQAVLYESDPDRMGATVGAPDDEYYDAAVDVIRSLRDRLPHQSVADVVRDVWPEADPELVLAVERAWARYSQESAR